MAWRWAGPSQSWLFVGRPNTRAGDVIVGVVNAVRVQSSRQLCKNKYTEDRPTQGFSMCLPADHSIQARGTI